MQVGPGDAFGQMMLRNIAARGCPLLVRERKKGGRAREGERGRGRGRGRGRERERERES